MSREGLQMAGHVCTVVFCLVTLLVTVLLVRTVTLGPRSLQGAPCERSDADFLPADDAVLARFRQGLRFKTVSRNPGDQNTDELLKLQNFIQQSYPLIHSSPLMRLEIIATYSMLYTVQGSDPELKPYMLTSHLDVVPADGEKWEEPPFSGNIRDGFIYGRGAIDVKQSLFAILESLEFMLRNGHKPKRSFYIAFGHDEEVEGGGAYAVGQVLAKRGVQLEYLMDEGLTIMDGIIQGVNKPAAMIGTSEKGYLTVRLSVNSSGGHSSMPGKESCIGILANAVARLEATPHPSMLGSGPEKGMFEHLAPEMSFPFRMIMSNLWFFNPLLSWVLSAKPASNAVVRTTTAVTEFHAGVKLNVIAPSAWATVNHRIHPAQTVKEVLEYDKRVVNDDRIHFEVVNSREPLPRSPYDDDIFGYQIIKLSIRQVWEKAGVVVAPGVCIGNTDTRHYTHLTTCIYRFSPTYMYPDDIARFHGFNERISLNNYQQAVNFYYHLMVNSDKTDIKPIHSHNSEL